MNQPRTVANCFDQKWQSPLYKCTCVCSTQPSSFPLTGNYSLMWERDPLMWTQTPPKPHYPLILILGDHYVSICPHQSWVVANHSAFFYHNLSYFDHHSIRRVRSWKCYTKYTLIAITTHYQSLRSHHSNHSEHNHSSWKHGWGHDSRGILSLFPDVPLQIGSAYVYVQITQNIPRILINRCLSCEQQLFASFESN